MTLNPLAPLLEVTDLSVRFRIAGLPPPFGRTLTLTAVRQASFSVAPGETLGVAGESGSGKTTLGRALIGLVPIHGGSARFRGMELRDLRGAGWATVRRHMGMMFQDPVGSLSPRLTVGSLIAEPFRIHGLTAGRDLRAEARRLLALVGLPAEFASRYPHQLSGGQARRVGVARAIALNPALLICDEPTAGLDVSVQGEILNLLARLQGDHGLALMVISHNLAVLRRICDRVMILYLGEVIEYGRAADIFGRPAHPYTQALLSAVPEPDPDKIGRRVRLTGPMPSPIHRPSGCSFHSRCPVAFDRCPVEAPAPRPLAAPGHMARCLVAGEVDAAAAS